MCFRTPAIRSRPTLVALKLPISLDGSPHTLIAIFIAAVLPDLESFQMCTKNTLCFKISSIGEANDADNINLPKRFFLSIFAFSTQVLKSPLGTILSAMCMASFRSDSKTMSPHFTYGKNDDSSIQPTLEIDLIRGMAFKFAFS